MTDPIVFVPGLNTTVDLFAHQIGALSATRTIVVANHRRHDSIADIGAAILDEAPRRFVLAALSMGGYVAFEMMRRAPERISALVLMDTTARPDTEEAGRNRRRLIDIAERGRFEDVPGLQMPMLVAPDRVDDPALVAVVRRMARETGPEVFVRQQRAVMARVDSRPFLSRIACPTLMIVGDRDAITPPEHAREIADGIPGARLVVLPDCGHLSTLERPEAVSAAIVGFLADAGR